MLVLEDAAEIRPGGSATARAWVISPELLPRTLAVGSVVTLLEGDRIVARAQILGVFDDPTPFPVSDLAAAKTRRLGP